MGPKNPRAKSQKRVLSPKSARPQSSRAAQASKVTTVHSRRMEQAEAKRAAILDAALELFSRLGLHGTTVDQIADAAFVSKTNLFYYFVSKEDIYVAVLHQLLDEWLAPLRAIKVDDDPVTSIRDYIRRKVDFSRAKPEASRLFCLEIVQGAPLIGHELRSSLKQLVDDKAFVIQTWIKSGKLAPVDPYHLIFAIWSTTQHYADFAVQVDALIGHKLDNAAFAEETINNIQHIILDGVRKRPTTPQS